jgi:hypothetical protein
VSEIKKTLTFVEIDLRRCSLVFGVSPCTATIDGSPQTGDHKCYNSPRTCQDPANFSLSTLTLRFAVATDYLPLDIDCIPSIKSVNTTPQIIKPGEDLGERESVTVTFNDHLHNDVGIDKYYAERGFNTYNNGSFWSKFKARWPYIQGSALRVIRGFEGDALGDMEIRHYVVENTAGPDSNGVFSITAKDVIKLLDGDKSQAPIVSGGSLNAAIDNNDTTITLIPAGIGNAEYPAAGIASIGDEQVTFTRSADTVTLTARGVDGSPAGDHEEGETFQIGIFYDGEDPADIIYDLITNYTEVDPAYIDLPSWQLETATYIARQYTAKILKPTSVRSLINELINQVGLVMYSDVVNQTIEMKALRQFITLGEIDENVIIQDSFSIKDQQDKRVSQVWTYYGQKNPLENLDQTKNYRTILATLDDDSISTTEGRQNSIRKIFSRWITVFNTPAAIGLNEIVLRRYVNAPRVFEFELPIALTPVLASGITLRHRTLQDDQGNASSATAQIVSLKRSEGRYLIVAEEMTFVQQAATSRLIVIDQNNFNLDPYFNLRAAHDSIYDDAESGDEVICVISANVIVGSKKNTDFAFIVGDWPEGVIVKITILGRMQGRGGESGLIGLQDNRKKNGGPTFYTRHPVIIDNTNGQIWSGGGAGSDSFSGAGAGYPPGTGANPPQNATTEAGGVAISSSFGDGGGPGEDGERASGFTVPEGDAGIAIDGESFITWIDEGDIRGRRIN